MKTQKTPKTKKATRKRHSKNIRQTAARYYIMGLTLTEISKLLDGISVRTLEKWQLSDKWTELKSPENIKGKVLLLNESGKTRLQIAEIVGKSISTVNRWIYEARQKD